MSERRLQFWYDFASTYSYVSAMRIEPLAAAAGVDVVWKPFLLGPLFAEWGWTDSPFNIYPVKGRYMWRDLERLCEAEGIPFERPSQFPRNGLLASRVAALVDSREWCAAFSRGVFSANFAEDKDISSWDTLAAILQAIGQDPDAVYEKALAADNKERLKRRTEEAMSLGIFGAPSFVVDGELFWGNDRLEAALAWCAKTAS